MSRREDSRTIEANSQPVRHFISHLERRERPFDPIPKQPKPEEEGGGPRRPDLDSPGKKKLLERMRKVDPKQAERYRQRTGE
ncbi:MAG: ubiquitin-like protein UBact [Nitrospirales bacterium]|nr:ubiquitin-like protein UBact [Nitrospirales bacterium]